MSRPTLFVLAVMAGGVALAGCGQSTPPTTVKTRDEPVRCSRLDPPGE